MIYDGVDVMSNQYPVWYNLQTKVMHSPPSLCSRGSTHFGSYCTPFLAPKVENAWQRVGRCHISLGQSTTRVHCHRSSTFYRAFLVHNSVARGQRIDYLCVAFLRLARFKRSVTFSGNTAEESGGAFAVLFGEIIRK